MYPKLCVITAEEYQDFIVKHSKRYEEFINPDDSLHVLTLGAAEELGEVMGKIKRLKRSEVKTAEQHWELVENIKLEIGDTIAYLTLIAKHFGIDLEDVLLANKRKLEARAEKGTLLGQGDDR
jgi:NTP pyrophosphatase (non-canonical NTP hydrolase)